MTVAAVQPTHDDVTNSRLTWGAADGHRGLGGIQIRSIPVTRGTCVSDAESDRPGYARIPLNGWWNFAQSEFR